MSFDAPESWTLSEPVFEIPGVEIDGDSVFLHIVMPGTFTDGGEIAVAVTQGEYQILYVDTLGRGINVLGRSGEGPEEFRRLTHVTSNGDTVVAWDWINGRVSLLADGEHFSQFSLRLRRSQTFVGRLANGLVVVTPKAYVMAGSTVDEADAISSGSPRPYTLLDRSGEEVATYLGPPDAGAAVFDFTPTREGTGSRIFHVGTECLPETLHMTVGDDMIIANTQDGKLLGLDQTGRLRTLFETEYRGEVRQDLLDRVERAIEWQEEAGPATSKSKKAARERVGQVGDPLPAVWAAMVADQRGGAWLQRASCYSTRPDAEATTWEVLDADWSLRATVRVPPGVNVLSVRGDLVLASITPDHEVPLLALYRIDRSSTGPHGRL